MNPLIINVSEFSPKVIFNPGENVFEISGDSRPENAGKFYTPILKWMDNYKTEATAKKPSRKLSFKFDFEYMNSVSTKYVFDMLKHIEALKLEGIEVEVLWCYNRHDEDMLDRGEEFTALLDIPMHFLPKQ